MCLKETTLFELHEHAKCRVTSNMTEICRRELEGLCHVQWKGKSGRAMKER